MGAHGTLEWLPGKSVALSATCWPEALIGSLPVIYPFIVNDPGEAAQAKRRIGAVTLGHMPPPLAEAGIPPTLARLERLLDDDEADELLELVVRIDALVALDLSLGERGAGLLDGPLVGVDALADGGVRDRLRLRFNDLDPATAGAHRVSVLVVAEPSLSPATVQLHYSVHGPPATPASAPPCPSRALPSTAVTSARV
jgi:hypothetical protein